MKTYTLSKRLPREYQLSAFLYEFFFFDRRWVVFNDNDTSDTLVFDHDGGLRLKGSGRHIAARWTFHGNDDFEFTLPSTAYQLHLLFMDTSLLVFQVGDSSEVFILVESSSLKSLGLTDLSCIESYIHASLLRNKKELEATLKAQQTENGADSEQIDGDSDYADGDYDESDAEEAETDDDDFDPDFDDEFSQYGDLTKEEIIYDYLQRQQEAQDEEDAYLQQH